MLLKVSSDGKQSLGNTDEGMLPWSLMRLNKIQRGRYILHYRSVNLKAYQKPTLTEYTVFDLAIAAPDDIITGRHYVALQTNFEPTFLLDDLMM